MRVISGIDQLRVYSHAIASTLNTPFHYMRDAKLLPDLAKIARDFAFVVHHRSAADYFQVRDLCQVGQDFILHAVRKKRVIRIAAAIFKRQHSDAFFRRCWV